MIVLKKKISIVLSVVALTFICMISMNVLADETASISNDNTALTLSSYSYTYDGNQKKPTVKAVYSNEQGSKKNLVSGKDYTVTYSNNVNAGTATVKIEGIGQYDGSATKTFKINPVNIANNKNISLRLGYYTTFYSGLKKTPKPYITWTVGGKKVDLVRDKDFTATYKNNLKMGKATIYLTGKGNFKGSFSKDFKIIPNQTTGLTSKVNGYANTNSITLKWDKQAGVSGYQVYKYDDKTKTYKYLKRVSPSQTTYTDNSVKDARRYYYKVRAYKTIVSGKTYYYGYFSDYTTNVTTPVRVQLTSVGKIGPNDFRVDWKAVRSAGYEVWYTSDPTFKTDLNCVRLMGGTRNTYTVRGVSRYRTYYVRVKAFAYSKGVQYDGYNSLYMATNYSNVYATYTSNYVTNYNRTTNMIIASKAINGKVIYPGQTFSFNDIVGPRTAKKGYRNAPVFTGGGVANELGGGICQVASTMFNTALNANVGIVERHQHSQRVTYVPLGRDAAIYGKIQDFRWKNTTKYPIKIEMKLKSNKITCTFKTTEYVKPSKVSLKVTKSSKKFTLRRYVNNRVNFTCTSKY